MPFFFRLRLNLYSAQLKDCFSRELMLWSERMKRLFFLAGSKFRGWVQIQGMGPLRDLLEKIFIKTVLLSLASASWPAVHYGTWWSENQTRLSNQGQRRTHLSEECLYLNSLRRGAVTKAADRLGLGRTRPLDYNTAQDLLPLSFYLYKWKVKVEFQPLRILTVAMLTWP